MGWIVVFLIGFDAVLLQMTLLREFLTVFSGNELDVGITMAVWLLGVGAGSFAGRTVRYQKALPLLLILVSLLCQPALVAVHSIRPAVDAGLGEVLSLPVTIGATVLILFPLCFLLGMLYPLAVAWFGGRAALVYWLEAIGSFVGGMLFSFFFAGWLLPFFLVTMVAVVSFFSAVMTGIIQKVGIKYLIISVIALIVSTNIPFYINIKDKVVTTINSRYGRIDIVRTRNQYTLYSSGRFLFSYPDSQTEEMTAHLSMSLHPLPSRILVVGVSPAAVRELLKYPEAAIELIEIDPKILRASLEVMGAEDRKALTSNRVRIVHEDARKYIKNASPETYDLLVMNLPEPATANINRLYTVEFFQEASKAFRNGGVIVLSLPRSFGYMGRQLQLANGTIYASLQAVFPYVVPSSEEYGILAASDRPIEANPSRLEERFRQRRVVTDVFRAELLDDVFDPLKRDAVRARLAAVEKTNTDKRPIAYLYNLLVWAEMQGARDTRAFIGIGRYVTYAVIALAVVVSALLWKSSGIIPYSVFLTGGITMAFSLSVILSFQAAFGYVYEAIGFLTAAFMAGVAGGSLLLRDVSPPLACLRKVQIAGIVLLLLSPFFLRNELTYYVVSFLCGATGGGEFAAAVRSMRGSGAADTAGKLYAYDLAGSFLGALMSSVILVPLFGMFLTLSGMVVVKVSSLAALFSLRNETT